MNPILLEIKDKKDLEQELYCPPHCFPHKFPFTKPIKNERCHTHSRLWRMLHHIPFCYLVDCPNYQFMMQNYKLDKQKKNNK